MRARRSNRTSFLQVAFESSSEIFGEEVQNPRGYRSWKGVLEVEGARLVGVRPVGLDHALRESASIVRESPQQVRFAILTRGRSDSILLELDGAGPDGAVRFELEASSGTSPISSLLPGAIVPPEEFRLSLRGLQDGHVEHELPVGPNADRVWLQAVDPDAPLDQELTYADLEGLVTGEAQRADRVRALFLQAELLNEAIDLVQQPLDGAQP